LRFKIGLSNRDQALLENIVSYLGCGALSFNNNTNSCYITVSSLQHHLDILIPLFDKNAIEGVKALDYADWRKVAYLMKEGCHRTKDGLKEIQEIKAGMNSKRISILVSN